MRNSTRQRVAAAPAAAAAGNELPIEQSDGTIGGGLRYTKKRIWRSFKLSTKILPGWVGLVESQGSS